MFSKIPPTNNCFSIIQANIEYVITNIRDFPLFFSIILYIVEFGIIILESITTLSNDTVIVK